MIGNHPGAF
jgi:hypothetical protein